jgi:hypothetical protein
MTFPGPAFLTQLDHVHQTDDGYIAQCPCWGCLEWVRIEPDMYDWTFACPVHENHDVVSYLLCGTRVDKRPQTRAWLCLRLALTPDAWGGLMLGRRVAPSAIDEVELARQKRGQLWN